MLCSATIKTYRRTFVFLVFLLLVVFSLHQRYMIHGDARYHGIRHRCWEQAQQPLDCSKILQGEPEEIMAAENASEGFKWTCKDEDWYMKYASNCSYFIKQQGYELIATDEELSFPVAYGLLIYKNIEQFERLLRRIYVPSNYYCVHVDAKSSKKFHEAVSMITNCLPNVVQIAQPYDIGWGEINIVLAQIECMKRLWAYSKKWKYFINLTGHEFPLKSNKQIVRILKSLKGFNIIDGHFKSLKKGWFEYVWWNSHMTPFHKSKPPHNITIAKGSNYVIASRGFVEYVIHSDVAKDLLDWMRNIYIPDEHYFATLNHNVHLNVPGAYKGDPDKRPKHHFFSKYIIWQSSDAVCRGRWLRYVCNLGPGDLQGAVASPALFLNKIILSDQPAAYMCLEEWHKNQSYTDQNFSTSYYKDIIKTFPR